MLKLGYRNVFKYICCLSFVVLFFTCTSFLNVFSNHEEPVLVQDTQEEEAPSFTNPVALLVGLNSNELSYREISNLAGYELFSIPYKSDIQGVIEQIKPTQVIIKHQSGFVGLYTPSGQLVRGVQTIYGEQAFTGDQTSAPSLLQPTEANPVYDNVFYPGSVVGSVPYGGLSYDARPRGKSIFRNFLKLLSFSYLAPFRLQSFGVYKPSDVIYPNSPNPPLGAVLLPAVPAAINSVSSYVDSRFDGAEYDAARSQPRDYKFQPIIEAY